VATTYYATINGQILYESTNGVRTEYIHDALGSVIATTDANRNVQNTYRWAGYGTQIAKTGTAADPKFLWNGTSGYRVTGRAHASHYVRRRHYGIQEAAWGGVDLLWLTFSPYGYALQRPILVLDVFGRQPWIPVRQFGYVDLLGEHVCPIQANLYWKLSVVPDNPPYNGILVQHVTVTSLSQCCDPPFNTVSPMPCTGCPVQSAGWQKTEWYEAFLVVDGVVGSFESNSHCLSLASTNGWVFTQPCFDKWTVSLGFGSCSYGHSHVTGELALTGLSQYFKGCPESCASSLPSSCTFKSVPWHAYAFATFTYACCGVPWWNTSGCPTRGCTAGKCAPGQICWGGDNVSSGCEP